MLFVENDGSPSRDVSRSGSGAAASCIVEYVWGTAIAAGSGPPAEYARLRSVTRRTTAAFSMFLTAPSVLMPLTSSARIDVKNLSE